MKSLILYGSPSKTEVYHQRISTPSGGEYFIRVEEFAGDFPEALDAALPREGETVLNTVEAL